MSGYGKTAPRPTSEPRTVTGYGLCGLERTTCAESARGEDCANNPFASCWARYYDRLLTAPLIGAIRHSEEQTLAGLMAETIQPTDNVLEIGPGTGHYTVSLCQRAAQVTAVEQSAEMLSLLDRRLEGVGATNCTVIRDDFLRVGFDETFDVVVLMGVLDYVTEPAGFLSEAAALARRALIFTTPYCGFLARVHRTCNRLRGVSISTYTPGRIRSYLPDFDVDIQETGRCSRLWRGMTLACQAVRS